MKELKLIQTRITPEIHKALEELAESKGRTIASMLRVIVNDHVNDHVNEKNYELRRSKIF